MTILSLFDGMSCGQIALRDMGIKIDKYYASEVDKFAIQNTMYNFPDTVQLGDVREIDARQNHRLRIIIEAGYLNRPNWHITAHDSPAIIAAKGKALGRNEQVARLLIQCAEWFARDTEAIHVRVEPTRPLTKHWKGANHKITHQELINLPQINIQATRTNQEERDAALLALAAATYVI